MRVLVTGAAGFLGSHLMLKHLFRGDQVLGVDNFCSSSTLAEHVDFIRKTCRASGHQGCLITADITSEASLWSAFGDFEAAGLGHQFDLIYNMACPASPPIYQAMPVETMKACTVGVMNVLEMAKEHRSIVVHASTSEVYGDPEVPIQAESYRGCVNSYGPRSCYDEGKRAAEALCYDYLNTHRVDARLIRIFNTYGPHMDPGDGRVVSNFICQALRGDPLTIYGHGQQTRSFCYVDDLVKGIVAMGELSRNPLTPINLGNPTEFTIKQLADGIQRKLGVSKFRMLSMPVDDPAQRCPDITKARDLLGWEPCVGLEEGLDSTIEYFRGLVK